MRSAVEHQSDRLVEGRLHAETRVGEEGLTQRREDAKGGSGREVRCLENLKPLRPGVLSEAA